MRFNQSPRRRRGIGGKEHIHLRRPHLPNEGAPQGIAEVIKQHLSNHELVFGPFGGSEMTGIAALTLGNEGYSE